jgi:hypothetical protein
MPVNNIEGEKKMKKSRLLGAICGFALAVIPLTASAATFNVLSGNFDVFDSLGGFVGGVPLQETAFW